MTVLSACSLEKLLRPDGFSCSCGRRHKAAVRSLFTGEGAIRRIPETLEELGLRRPMLLCGPYGYEAAGQAVRTVLQEYGIPFGLYVIRPGGTGRLKPDEQAVGSACLHFDHSCDCVLAVGSGVINDVGKVVSKTADRPLLTVATAPSMDGYASDNASMEVEGIKLSLPEQMPAAVFCDIRILSQAPPRMIRAGLGDILAKTTALCDWKLSHLVTGEYYCASVAALAERSLRKTLAFAPALDRDRTEAVSAITEGLLLSGLAIAFAGSSHPASGLEHYFSHCWEMMCLERGREYELHGIQVGVGTLLTLRLAEALKEVRPEMARVEAAAARFDGQAWEANLRRVFPRASKDLLSMEKRVMKNAREGRLRRAERAIEHWDEVKAVLAALPSAAETEKQMRALGMPVRVEEIGMTAADAADAFVCSRDIRDKYLLSSLIWDLGYMDDFVPLVRDT